VALPLHSVHDPPPHTKTPISWRKKEREKEREKERKKEHPLE